MTPLHNLDNLDAYISQELSAEAAAELRRHLETCASCAVELKARVDLRAQVKAAVRRQGVPAGLETEVLGRIRGHQAPGWWNTGAGRAGLALAAALVLGCGVWWNAWRNRMPALSDGPGQAAYIERVSARVAAVLRSGLDQHIMCAVFRRYPANPPADWSMQEELGPSYQGLLELVKGAVPAGYRVIMAHRCTGDNREFIHLTLQRGDNLISVLITRKKEWESMSGLPLKGQPAGIALHESAAGRYEVAGFETAEYLVFVVSDLNGRSNLDLTANLAPGVGEFLGKVPG